MNKYEIRKIILTVLVVVLPLLLVFLYFVILPKGTPKFPETGPTDFITTWKTDNPGASPSNQITIPTSPEETYNYNVDWGDESSDTDQTGDATHTYASPGTYTVSISGTFPRIHFDGAVDKDKILSVEQWGNTVWTSMNAAFYDTTNLVINATDAPDLSLVTDMSFMFQGDIYINQNISTWNVSNVTDMSFMFANATSFNQDIGSWNVSNVTNMSGMFLGDIPFNQNIGAWEVSNVTNMSQMFQGVSSFNQNIGAWNVSNVTNMSSMFSGATSFNQNISSWNVSNVTDMGSMFSGVTLSKANYDLLLAAWSLLPLKSNVSFDAGSSTYCSSSIQRENIITNFTWTIADGGLDCTRTLTYTSGANGTISGVTPQTVADGEDGTEVTAIANSGYHFTTWSDSVLTASRTDTAVSGDINVTANFESDNVAPTPSAPAPATVGASSGGSSSGGFVTPPVQPAYVPLPTPVRVTASSFTRDLSMGSVGEDVKTLQGLLNEIGFMVALTGPGSPTRETTHFGIFTKAAVTKFQTKYGIIPMTGYFGSETRAKMTQLFGI